jgi:hypothetical protein
MPRELICPHCGNPVRLDEVDEPLSAVALAGAGCTIETVVPGTQSADEIVSGAPMTGPPLLLSPEPDVGLAAAAEIGPAIDSAPPSPIVRLLDVGAPPASVSSSEVAARVSELIGGESSTGGSEAPAKLETPKGTNGSAHDFPALDLGATSDLSPTLQSSTDEDRGEPEPARRPSRLFVLLGSYASAMTLACFWLVWQARARHQPSGPDTLPSDSRPDLLAGGDRAVRLAPLPAIARSHLTRIGKAITVGSLEITPVSVHHDAVVVEHMDLSGTVEPRDGGEGALVLRLRLKNVSPDTTFAPLNAAFVRERDRGLPDSVIEMADGSRLGMYPLAASSEWSIRGQDFHDLKPGEVLETIVVSDKDAAARETAEMTWRLRLRTSADRTETVGVSIRRNEIH